MNKVKVSKLYKSLIFPCNTPRLRYTLYVMCGLPWRHRHVSPAIYYNRFATTWRSAYRRDEYKANSFIASNGWKLVEYVGLFNMINKPTLCILHKFDHQWLNMQTATSFSLQIFSSSSVARLASLKKSLSQSVRTHYISIFFNQEFIFYWFDSKVKC